LTLANAYVRLKRMIVTSKVSGKIRLTFVKTPECRAITIRISLAALCGVLLMASGCSSPPAEVTSMSGRPSARQVLESEGVGDREFHLIAWTRRAPTAEVNVARSDVCFRLLENSQSLGGQCSYIDFPTRNGSFSIFRTTSGSEQIIGAISPPEVQAIRLRRIDGSETLIPAGGEFAGVNYFLAVFGPSQHVEGLPVPLDEQGNQMQVP